MAAASASAAAATAAASAQTGHSATGTPLFPHSSSSSSSWLLLLAAAGQAFAALGLDTGTSLRLSDPHQLPYTEAGSSTRLGSESPRSSRRRSRRRRGGRCGCSARIGRCSHRSQHAISSCCTETGTCSSSSDGQCRGCSCRACGEGTSEGGQPLGVLTDSLFDVGRVGSPLYAGRRGWGVMMCTMQKPLCVSTSLLLTLESCPATRADVRASAARLVAVERCCCWRGG
jgi:hypothetical protein